MYESLNHAAATVRRGSAVAVLLAASLATLGCKQKPAAYKTTGAGHTVEATVEGGRTSVDSNERQVVISSEHGKVIVEPNRVMIEGLGWTPIPEKVDVTVEIEAAKTTVKAAEVSVTRGTK